MRTDLLTTAAFAALLLTPIAAAAQSSGYASAPFREHPVEVAQGAALERIDVAARALALKGAEEDAEDEDSDAADSGEAGDGEDEEEEEGGPLDDFGLLRASLAAASPELEQRLGAAIAELLEAAEDGKDLGASSEEVVGLTQEARGKLLPPTVADAPGFRAALMASLLLDEGGVAEGFEEASEGEASAYTLGYVALQRVKALWEGLSGQASPQQAADVAAMFVLLDALFPTAEMPEQISPDPEQAEAPAQQLVALLEGVADAELYLGRDLAAAMTVVNDVAAQGCAALAAGQAGLGVEKLRIAAAYYDQTVVDTLGMIAPDTAAVIAEALEEVDEGEADELAEACGPLLQGLAAGRTALTP